ncbi:uncharacterized protein [Epargyreus clarus]|uniref:uncharacterized protein n=1 Tax=Epargyreus clarus TaxID=520877 RepID=UPI003C2FD378
MFCDIPDLGRCCFCMPLRRGILTFGYLNVVFSAFMVGIYSMSVHMDMDVSLLFHGVSSEMDDTVCLVFYCVDILFNLALVYGAHRKILIYIKVYYNYAIATILLMIVLEIISMATSDHFVFLYIELLGLFFAGICLHVYLLILTRSLIRKMQISEQHTYENQLHTIVNGDVKVEGNGVYPSTVIPNEVV